jgi:hypothetical protein
LANKEKDYFTKFGCEDFINKFDYVEVRHGYWMDYPSEAHMKCSICDMEYHKSRMPKIVGYCPNPNCGAKMDGERKE